MFYFGCRCLVDKSDEIWLYNSTGTRSIKEFDEKISDGETTFLRAEGILERVFVKTRKVFLELSYKEIV